MSNLSLSLVLPVHNAQRTLARTVQLLLEILPDLSPQFEVLIVNDGSTDQTEEVATELVHEFPQVRLVGHTTRRGRTGVVETALRETQGDILIVQDENGDVDSCKLRRIWELRHEDEALLDRRELLVKRSLLQRLAAWGVRLEDAPEGGSGRGVQLIRRDLGRRIPGAAGRKSRNSHLAGERDAEVVLHASGDRPAANRRS